MDKRLTQAYNLLMRLKITPKSIDQAGRLVDAFMMNINFEQMKEEEHHHVISSLDLMFLRYRLIRGR